MAHEHDYAHEVVLKAGEAVVVRRDDYVPPPDNGNGNGGEEPPPHNGNGNGGPHVPPPEHDIQLWHSAVGEDGTEYAHEHGMDPTAVDHLFGHLGSVWGAEPGQGISYPWHTLPYENLTHHDGGKHEGYVIFVSTRDAGQAPGVVAARCQMHMIPAKMGALVRTHSFSLDAMLRNSDGTLGRVSIGGWIDFGHLRLAQDYHVPLPGDPDPIQAGGARRIHHNAENIRRMTTWYGHVTPSRGIRVQIGCIRDTWDWLTHDTSADADPVAPLISHPHEFTRDNRPQNGTRMEAFHLLAVHLGQHGMRPFNGQKLSFVGRTDRYGSIHSVAGPDADKLVAAHPDRISLFDPEATPIKLDSVPIVVDNVEFRSSGNVQLRDNTEVFTVSPEHRHLIKFPN